MPKGGGGGRGLIDGQYGVRFLPLRLESGLKNKSVFTAYYVKKILNAFLEARLYFFSCFIICTKSGKNPENCLSFVVQEISKEKYFLKSNFSMHVSLAKPP